MAIGTYSEVMKETLAQVAPGTQLGDGLERILRGRTGALIVLGMGKSVESISSGGFDINTEFTPTKLRELAKMDGAIILDHNASTILKAGVQLVPDPSIRTEESGTRHRTAERVAVQTGTPVISVSQSMNIIALYVAGKRHVLEGSEAILARANQALQTMERYRQRLDKVMHTLSVLEIEANVTAKDVALALQREEMVRRIAREIEHYVLELGQDGRLVGLQLEELKAGLGSGSELVLRDYQREDPGTDDGEAALQRKLEELSTLSASDIIDLTTVSKIVDFGNGTESLEAVVPVRGYRMLSNISAVPPLVAIRLINYFQSLQSLMAANVHELMEVEQIGEQRARVVRDGLSRMAEASLIERYN